ncbi:hypothetical protein BpHYR1_027949 [Brachionus plicatilis]|uniref:Uncharacterized protein n=1 Tax=Brachionus plicatilis TaxID=10195 RepID=A0A3M7R310_BRAPC|nr:hypothetical protein BpHYR1_027949 [Brachionus plicatilis]
MNLNRKRSLLDDGKLKSSSSIENHMNFYLNHNLDTLIFQIKFLEESIKDQLEKKRFILHDHELQFALDDLLLNTSFASQYAFRLFRSKAHMRRNVDGMAIEGRFNC